MAIPLVLAGPILRRVEPALLSVWIALREAASLELLVWEGRASSGRSDPLLASAATGTLRLGAGLHLAEVTIQIPATAGKLLQPDTLYSYDLKITTADQNVHDLASLGMLQAGLVEEVERVPLGFEPGLLPSFAPPRLEDLNILYGSCRRPGHPDPDALAMVDALIFDDDRYKNPSTRPHQLFLGGDQIYADDVAVLHMLVLQDLALKLIGTAPDGSPVEHLRLDRILERKQGPVDPLNPAASYQPEPQATTTADPDLPADRRHFPEDLRKPCTLRDAQFTSSDGSNHMLSLGEFAALYLTVWSNALWGTEIPLVRFAPDPSRPQDTVPILWADDSELPEAGGIVMPDPEFPPRIAGSFYVAPTTAQTPPSPADAQAAAVKRDGALRRQLKVLREFHKGLPKVQRVLANVPTYMILDDHDVTDDFFLNPIWRDRVLTTQLGQDILRNAMLSYALFQDWGNVPLDYLGGPKAELLTLAPRLFPSGAAKGPDRTAADRLATLFGHDLRNQPTPDGRYASVRPPLTWHFTIDGPKHRAIALDNRTRRSYASRNGPPGNVSIEAMLDQIPEPPLPAGREILIVVAPLQVIGPPVLDDLVAPAAYRAFDLKGLSSNSDLSPSSATGLREMVGTNPDAIEAWSFDAPTFEHFLDRLEPYGRVVILSGDVHYSSATVMSYWRGNAARPARFAQFTSSGFKNVMPSYITFVDRGIGFAQQLVRANLGTERLGWDRPADDLVLLPQGATSGDLVPVMRARLDATPVLLPTWGWLDRNDPDASVPDPALTTRLNPAAPPDWRWRVRVLRDERSDDQRPEAIRPLPIDETAVARDLADPATLLSAYQTLAARHQFAMKRLRNARQFLFRGNVGRLVFRSHPDGRLEAVQEIYTTFTAPDDVVPLEPTPQAVLVQVAPLGPEDEAAPERLRAKAIEPFRPEVA
ncbi:MAG: hypothetical protein KDA73_11400 [Rhodobacteraceae bacterium]|nr:hypothetical protein [Paracoccaceae bacterium]